MRSSLYYIKLSITYSVAVFIIGTFLYQEWHIRFDKAFVRVRSLPKANGIEHIAFCDFIRCGAFN
jgi:hypothetical protein